MRASWVQKGAVPFIKAVLVPCTVCRVLTEHANLNSSRAGKLDAEMGSPSSLEDPIGQQFRDGFTEILSLRS